MMIRVLVADNQALVRAGFVALLDAQDGIAVIAEADTGTAALAAARELRPDVVLMDIRMPEMDGLAATRAIAADPTLAEVRVVVLTTFELDEYVFEAMRAGASGFLVKHTEPAELVRAVWAPICVWLHLPPVRYAVVASRGVWRSLVARFVRDEEVVGSNPATPTRVVADHRP
jgi:DNA-binding NarL/FixJ family response regulator